MTEILPNHRYIREIIRPKSCENYLNLTSNDEDVSCKGKMKRHKLGQLHNQRLLRKFKGKNSKARDCKVMAIQILYDQRMGPLVSTFTLSFSPRHSVDQHVHTRPAQSPYTWWRGVQQFAS